MVQPAAVPTSVPVAAPAPTAPAGPALPPGAETLPAQLAEPLAALRRAPNGEHIVTVRVSPDNLGPVTVRAHLGDGSMRVELFAPTAVARDALTAMLPDLRRDLAAASSAANAPGSTTLDVGTGSAPSDGGRGFAGSPGSGGGASGERPGAGTPQRWQPARIDDLAGRAATPPSSRPRSGGTSLLDVLA
jgi:hypothetical protein